jgi:LmbE family N-acetylglucosaminyl deacetylase
MNGYRDYVAAFARLFREGQALPLGAGGARPPRVAASDAPRALIFSPHPDDECIVGALPLRLQREAGMRVVDVAVTLGSNRARQAARWQELQAACTYLGFDLVSTGPHGLEGIDAEARRADPARWDGAVAVIAGILAEHRPAVVFLPHDGDWNRTHVGTHHLVMDALRAQGAGFTCVAVETEFWGAMATPNRMVESSPDDVAELMAALALHVGEVQRNPYHLRLPAWMMDNVRRGAELVGGQGGASPDFVFATLYRAGRWSEGRLQPAAGASLAAARPITLSDLLG